jgi:hypothetical protein
VDFPAGLRKSSEFCVLSSAVGNFSTMHALVSHALLTNSPHERLDDGQVSKRATAEVIWGDAKDRWQKAAAEPAN